VICSQPFRPSLIQVSDFSLREVTAILEGESRAVFSRTGVRPPKEENARCSSLPLGVGGKGEMGHNRPPLSTFPLEFQSRTQLMHTTLLLGTASRQAPPQVPEVLCLVQIHGFPTTESAVQ
jgi:hypothetical protein